MVINNVLNSILIVRVTFSNLDLERIVFMHIFVDAQ